DLVVNVVFVVGPCLFDLPDDVEIFAHRHHPLANQISAGRPPLPAALSIRARPLVLNRYSAAPIRSPDLFRPNRSRIAVLVMPSAAACWSARSISSATGSPSELPKM